MKYKYNLQQDRKKKEEREARKAEREQRELTQEDIEKMVDKELDETLKKMEREKKKQLKKEREREAKQDVRKKMSVIASSTINYDEDLTLDKKTRDILKKIDIEDVHKYVPQLDSENEENMDPIERKYKFFNDGAKEEKFDGESFDSDVDDTVARIDKMANEIGD